MRLSSGHKLKGFPFVHAYIRKWSLMVMYYLQLNKTSPSFSRSISINLPVFKRFVFVGGFSSHPNILIDPYICRCRFKWLGIKIISSCFFFGCSFDFDKFSVPTAFNFAAEPVLREMLSSRDNIWWFMVRLWHLFLLVSSPTFLFSILSFPWPQSTFCGVEDIPSVFLRTFLQPWSIMRYLLWEVFMRKTRGNTIKYTIPLLITTGSVVALKITIGIIVICQPIISRIEIMKVTWALTLIFFVVRSSWGNAQSSLRGFFASLRIIFGSYVSSKLYWHVMLNDIFIGYLRVLICAHLPNSKIAYHLPAHKYKYPAINDHFKEVRRISIIKTDMYPTSTSPN